MGNKIFKDGEAVRVWNDDLSIEQGTIWAYTGWPKMGYWVQLPGQMVNWYDADRVFPLEAPKGCDCGAKKVGSPGHAYWCATEKR